MKHPKQIVAAFTLIELLVVITIIAILAGIALPVYNTVTERGQQTKALSNAKQIGLACKLFAADNDGNYPQAIGEGSEGSDIESDFSKSPADANEAFKQLIPDYAPSEQIFYLAKSRWSPNPPDNKITDIADRLKAGENHWAYVPLLTDTSNPNFPLIADGFSTTVGVYTDKETEKGGIWKGKKAIVIRADQSGSIEQLNKEFKVVGKIGGGTKEDIFSTSSNNNNWIPAQPVNPAGND